MKIAEIMTRSVKTTTPDQSIREAARLMEKIDSGALLVHENDRLIGMITDRDIAIRGVAAGLDGNTPVREVMSANVLYCFEDEDIQHVAENMSDLQVRRLPVLNRDKQLVGVVSLGNISGSRNTAACTTVMHGVARAH